MAHNRRMAHVMIGLFLMAIAAAPLQMARADTGPKPTMKFQFTFEIPSAPTIVSGIQEECSQADCADARPLMEAGPQSFNCTPLACSSMAYSYSEYHRLTITFSDGVTRQRNVFTKKNFYAQYKAAI